jgi:Putative auto-transporter adhesin, head GIN domain
MERSFGAGSLKLATAVFVLAVSATSQAETRWIGFGSKTVVGSGNVITVPREIGKFDRVEVGDGIRATLRQSGSQKLVVTADDNVAPLVEMQLNATTLRVRIKPNTNLRTKTPVAVAIDFTELDQLHVRDGARAELDVAKAARFVAKASDGSDLQIANIESGDVEIVVSDGANARVSSVRKAELLSYRLSDGARLTVDTSNGAQTKLKLQDGSSFTSRGINATLLEVAMSDGASAKLSGNATEQRFTLNDGASLDARDLRGSNAIAKVVDASSLELGVLQKLDLKVQDGGSIRYTGEPAIHALKSDGGSIRKY